MGFNSVFKGLIPFTTDSQLWKVCWYYWLWPAVAQCVHRCTDRQIHWCYKSTVIVKSHLNFSLIYDCEMSSTKEVVLTNLLIL